MVGPTPSSLDFMDELDWGSFFDQVDDLIHFPCNDIDAVLSPCPDDNNGRPISAADIDESFPPPSIWAAHPGSASDSVFPSHGGPDLSAELSVPYEDIVQLEWLSTFVEDSFSGGSLAMNKNECPLLEKDFSSSSTTTLSHQQQFQTSSPVSVLESSSSCSGEQKPAALLSPEANVGAAGRCGRARSKRPRPRPRPATFTPRPAMQQLIVSPTSSVTEMTPMCPVNPPKLTPSHESDSHAESRLLIKIPKHLIKSEHKTKKKKKQKKVEAAVPPPPAMGPEEQNNESGPQQQQAVRKCMHCEVTKTPQWRAGPMGPKTLCNACGVRFKSGRLFPEYRPAASPAFIPSLHSNSHKKVVEMRTKTPLGGEIFGMATGDTSMVPDSPELLIPNHSNPAMDYM